MLFIYRNLNILLLFIRLSLKRRSSPDPVTLTSILDAIPFPSLFYWSERYEVDFVIDPLGRTISIEVKYRERVEESDLKGLKSFNEKFKPSISLVITKDQLFKRDLIVFMPVWLHLLIC